MPLRCPLSSSFRGLPLPPLPRMGQSEWASSCGKCADCAGGECYVHHVDNEGDTALSRATANSHAEIVAALEARIAELAALEAADKATEKDSKDRKRRT